VGGLVKYGSNSLAQFLDAPDSIYGTAVDGSVVFDGTTTILSMVPSSSVYSMTRDIYCYNLTLNDSVRLAPNGYRIFVKNLLTLGNASTIGYTGGYSTDGSIKQGAAATVSVTHSLGGSGTGAGAGTATAPTSATGGSTYYQQPSQAVKGYSVTGGAVTETYLRGGAGGSTGIGGGVVICAARYIACTATGTNAKFAAPGGATGGGGGVVLVVSTGSALPTNVSTDVAGNGGAASGTYNFMQLV
jgi:hypothetical protein